MNIDEEIEKIKTSHKNDESALYRYLHLVSNKKDGKVDMNLFDTLAKETNASYKSKYGDTALIEVTD